MDVVVVAVVVILVNMGGASSTTATSIVTSAIDTASTDSAAVVYASSSIEATPVDGARSVRIRWAWPNASPWFDTIIELSIGAGKDVGARSNHGIGESELLAEKNQYSTFLIEPFLIVVSSFFKVMDSVVAVVNHVVILMTHITVVAHITSVL